MISKNRIKFIHALALKKHRKEQQLFVAEGHKLVEELLPVFDCVYLAAHEEWLTEHQTLADRLKQQGTEINSATTDELQKASLLKHPQDVLALFKPPTHDVNISRIISNQLCLALDGVQDPGNLGTILRIADWFGIEHVFCSTDTADIYNPKTIQATMGAIARVKVHYLSLPELLKEAEGQTPVYGTFLDGENIYHKTLSRNGIIVMGNEGNGVSSEVKAYIRQGLYIPNYPSERSTSESLNVAVATAIVCAEFRRRS